MTEDQANSSAGSGGADRIAALGAKLEGLGSLFGQLEDARAAARRTRVGVVLVILLVFLGYGLVIYRTFTGIDKEELMAEVQSSLMNVATHGANELTQVAKELAPVYSEELRTQFSEEWPNISEQIKAEGDELLGNITKHLDSDVRARFNAMAKRQQERVLTEFDMLKDPAQIDLVMENLEHALRDATYDVLNERVGKAETRFRAVNEKILLFLPEERRSGFQSDLSRVWEDLLRYRLRGMEMIEPK
jgi:hypothetical protein